MAAIGKLLQKIILQLPPIIILIISKFIKKSKFTFYSDFCFKIEFIHVTV